jgi:hypothetical protein
VVVDQEDGDRRHGQQMQDRVAGDRDGNGTALRSARSSRRFEGATMHRSGALVNERCRNLMGVIRRSDAPFVVRPALPASRHAGHDDAGGPALSRVRRHPGG